MYVLSNLIYHLIHLKALWSMPVWSAPLSSTVEAHSDSVSSQLELVFQVTGHLALAIKSIWTKSLKNFIKMHYSLSTQTQ